MHRVHFVPHVHMKHTNSFGGRWRPLMSRAPRNPLSCAHRIALHRIPFRGPKIASRVRFPLWKWLLASGHRPQARHAFPLPRDRTSVGTTSARDMARDGTGRVGSGRVFLFKCLRFRFTVQVTLALGHPLMFVVFLCILWTL